MVPPSDLLRIHNKAERYCNERPPRVQQETGENGRVVGAREAKQRQLASTPKPCAKPTEREAVTLIVWLAGTFAACSALAKPFPTEFQLAAGDAADFGSYKL
jgi:hypothetical protein